MSEELIPTKDETVNKTPGTPTAVPPVDTDVSNIVPFASEMPGSTELNSEGVVKEASAEISSSASASSASAISDGSGGPVPGTQAQEPAAKEPELSQKVSELKNKAADFTDKASEFTGKASEFTSKAFKRVSAQKETDTDYEMPDEEPADKKRFHFKKEDKEFFRDKWILSRISDENLMDYLTLEQKRNELQQQARDIKEKRIMKAIELTISLAAIVAVIYLLRDNPTILVNILYITGILVAFWFWKNPRDK